MLYRLAGLLILNNIFYFCKLYKSEILNETYNSDICLTICMHESSASLQDTLLNTKFSFLYQKISGRHLGGINFASNKNQLSVYC